MRYQKPHLSLDQQLELLRQRGLLISNPDESRRALAEIGYYRLAAYLYPFRKPKPEDLRTTHWNYRFDEFEPSSTFESAIAIYDFDRRLRHVLFEGLELLEVGLRSRISNCAGTVDVFIHLKPELLDADECARRSKGSSKTRYDQWRSKYREQVRRASGEDFIKHHRSRYGEHHRSRYDDELPVWLALEVSDFGSITHLYNLLPKDVKNEIARYFGVTQGAMFASWLRSFNYTRNLVAHHSRIWNRVFVTRPQIPNPATVRQEIHHLQTRKSSKLYPPLSLLAYCLLSNNPANGWNLRAAETILGFPEVSGFSPPASMGFPENWDQLALWHSDSTPSHRSREHLPHRDAHNHDAEQEHEPGFQPVGVVLEGDGVAEEQHRHDVEQECDEHAADD